MTDEQLDERPAQRPVQQPLQGPVQEPVQQPGQLDLLPALTQARLAVASARAAATDRPPAALAPSLPVARVLVDVPLAHLDRPFDYLVPEAWDDQVRAGCRVKVRFAGQDVDGFVLERVEASDHLGRLAPLRRSVSSEPVLTPDIARLCQAVAERYAGSRADVLRLAVPPRHARVEKAAPVPTPESEPETEPASAPDSQDAATPSADAGAWARYLRGPELLTQLRTGTAPRRVWSALPGEDWAARLAAAAAATLASGRGSVLCVPDRRDLDRLDSALTAELGRGRHVLLSADLGPAARYRSFLAVSRGHVQVVAGTRAAAFAPVRRLGLVAIWDDGDDLHAEPRAPYPHAREVLLLRAHQTGCAALVGGVARSVEAAALVESGWAEELVAERHLIRSSAPLVSIPGASDHDLQRDPMTRSSRLPSSAAQVIRSALETGPVLVQTPRSGYAGVLVCDSCRTPARCEVCTGPLHLPDAHRPPTCRWCGQVEQVRRCRTCGGRGLRTPAIGEQRTAEELGRAFPRTSVRRSAGDQVLDAVDARPAIVVATPGAEPPAEGGYAAVVLLDTWLMLARPDLRTVEESARRWFNAAALARPGDRGGRVVAVGDPAAPALQALVRWDPAGFAEREAADRASAHLPPASRLAVLTGPAEAVDSALMAVRLPPGAEILGPVPTRAPGPAQGPTQGRTAGRTPAPALSQGQLPGPTPVLPPSRDDGWVRVVVRVPRAGGPALTRSLGELQRLRSARKLTPVRVQVDPVSLT